jgi:ribose transport system permease protein
VWQLKTLQSGAGVPQELRDLGSNLVADVIPLSLVVFIPVAALIIIGLRRTGYGRMLFALGDNPTAARLSGVRSWQVLTVLYVISALLAAIAGLIYSGLSNTASVTLVEEQLLPCIAAAVIGGTSIAGGRGTFTGTILGAIILSVLGALLTILLLPEPARQIVFGAIVVLVAAAYTRATSEG